MISNSIWSAFQGMMQGHTPGVNTWDWEAGEPSPYGIKAPWLGYAWHYNDQGRIVPNNPDNPSAPWNQPGATTTFNDYLASQPIRSLGATQGFTGGSNLGVQRTFEQESNPLAEAMRKRRYYGGGY